MTHSMTIVVCFAELIFNEKILVRSVNFKGKLDKQTKEAFKIAGG